MTPNQFEALVGKLERRALLSPRGYTAKVLLLAALGNSYLALVLVLITALLFGLVISIAYLKAIAVKLTLVVGFFIWTILKALWVKLTPPEGEIITARQAPELFSMIRELRSQLNAPDFHQVLITADFNAGIVQVSRLGLFGWSRNYLMIGLPLMKSLTVEQFKAVLAHEFGHLARGHGRVSNWIYRQRLRWAGLTATLDARRSRGSFLFKPFLDWFTPYFNAWSFPMARANEYAADATSVKLTSAQTTAEALTSVSVVDRFLTEHYWPDIYKHADFQQSPGFTPYLSLTGNMATKLGDGAENLMVEAMEIATGVEDTHPSLSDRLKAIGESPRLNLPNPGTAADILLGPSLKALTEDFDRRWKDRIQESWKTRYESIQEAKQRLIGLNDRAANGEELSVAEALDRARLTEALDPGTADALEQIRALNLRDPEDAHVCFTLGTFLLNRSDESGCGYLEKALQLDDSLLDEGAIILRNHYLRTGKNAEASGWSEQLLARGKAEEADRIERTVLRIRDTYRRHGLPDDDVHALKEELKGIPGIRKVYLVQKVVTRHVERPCYVLGFSATGLLQLYRKRRAQQVQEMIQKAITFRGQLTIINVDGPNYRFGRKFFWMRGSRIL